MQGSAENLGKTNEIEIWGQRSSIDRTTDF